MSFVPEACMAYTKVFTTLKFEVALAMMAGVVVGALAQYWSNK